MCNFHQWQEKKNIWWPQGALLVDGKEKRDLVAIGCPSNSWQEEKGLGGH